MIYNVYHKGGNAMKVTISKWGNSLGFRIPTRIVDALNIKSGDSMSYELVGEEMILRKEKSTRDMFAEFYGKPLEELSIEDLGKASELDWGDDIGGEIF